MVNNHWLKETSIVIGYFWRVKKGCRTVQCIHRCCSPNLVSIFYSESGSSNEFQSWKLPFVETANTNTLASNYCQLNSISRSLLLSWWSTLNEASFLTSTLELGCRYALVSGSCKLKWCEMIWEIHRVINGILFCLFRLTAEIKQKKT